MNLFLRMARLARHPPSLGRVKLVCAVVALCLIIYGVERFWGWPDWLTPNSGKLRLPK